MRRRNKLTQDEIQELNDFLFMDLKELDLKKYKEHTKKLYDKCKHLEEENKQLKEELKIMKEVKKQYGKNINDILKEILKGDSNE